MTERDRWSEFRNSNFRDITFDSIGGSEDVGKKGIRQENKTDIKWKFYMNKIGKLRKDLDKQEERQKNSDKKQENLIKIQNEKIEKSQTNFITILGLFAAITIFILGSVSVLQNSQTALAMAGMIIILLSCVLVLVGAIGFISEKIKEATRLCGVGVVCIVIGGSVLLVDGQLNPAKVSNSIDFIKLEQRVIKLEFNEELAELEEAKKNEVKKKEKEIREIKKEIEEIKEK